MKKKVFPFLAIVLIAFAIMPLTAGTVFAEGEPFTIDEITYTPNDGEQTAVVSGHTNDLPANVTISAKVTNDGKEYTVTSIGDNAFWNTGLESVTFETGSSLKTIGQSAFASCYSLKTITIPASVTSIGQSAFSSCYSLKTITIPASVTSIGESAFTNSGLESVTFETGTSLEVIGVNVFGSCGNLKTITIPASVTSIGENAFSWGGLQSITFEPGSRLETIGDKAFMKTHLTMIHYLGDEAVWGSVTKGNNWAPSNPAVHCVTDKTTRKATPDADGYYDRYICNEEGCGDWGYGGTVIRRPVISLSETSFDYDGTVKKPEVSVEDTAGETIAASNYDVTIRNSAGTEVTEPVEAGNYTVAVQMKGDSYSGAKELAYSIKKSIQDAEVLLSATAYTYNGTVQKPTIGTIGGMDLTEGTDYTAVWSNESSANAGTYTVTITGKDFYTGTTSASYKIDPKAVTVKANNASKTYGKNDPAKFTATTSGLVGTDTLTYTVAREPGEDAGTYAIIPTGETEQGNYIVSYENGTFTIDPKAVTVKANNASKTYGKNDPAKFTATTSGLVGTDTLTYTVAREKGNKAGKYAIIPTGEAAQGNYAVTYENGIFTINQAANTMKIKAKTATVKGSTKGKKGTLKKTKTLGVTKVIKFTNKGQGTKTYVKKSGNKKITIAKKTGKVTVKKGLKKGTYKVKIKVKAKGNANYKASAWKTVTFKITVK